jgi:hypothetical protein
VKVARITGQHLARSQSDTRFFDMVVRPTIGTYVMREAFEIIFEAQ